MFRRYLPLVLAAAVCLLAAASAAADPDTSGRNGWRLPLFGGNPALSFIAAAPTVQINSAPSDPTNEAAATFNFATTDAVTIECRLDTNQFSACTSPTSYTGLADGDHSFTVRATDAVGGSAEAGHNWTVDTVAPTASIGTHPADPTNVTSASFDFSANEPATLQCKLDTEGFSLCTSAKTYANLADGAHTFTVKATDTAGNTGPEASFNWKIDTVGPAASIVDKPTNPTNDNSPTFTFSSSEPGTFQCKLDGAQFAACTSPTTYTTVADGPHTFVVRTVDALGNPGPEASYTWTIDTVAPTPSITQKPGPLTNSKSARFAFTVSEPATVQCKLDTAAFENCSSPKNYSNLADGAHTFTVKATDPAANSGQDTHSWTIDSVAPTTTITQKPTNPSNDASPSFAFTVSEPANAQCKLDGGAFTNCSSPVTYDTADGRHTFTVKATDPAGNTGPEASFGWTVDTVAPSLLITQKPAALTNSKAAGFTFVVSEPATVQCRLDAAAFENCSSPKNYSNLAEGAHTFTVKATDSATNSGETSYQWTVDTVAPTTTITQQPTNPSNDASPSFAFTLSEPAAAQCKLDGAAFTNCSSPVTYDAADGLHTFTARATDPAGNTGPATPAYTWRIDTVPPTATITHKPPGSTSSPTFVFSANEASTFTCSLDHASPTSCSSPTTYTGLGDGPHSFAVTPTDAAGNTGPAVTHDWTIETRAPTAAVMSGPTALSNSSSATFTFTADEPSSFDCKLDDRGFEACGSPASYHGLGDGPHTFSVQARDPSGNLSTPVAYGWSIDATAPETVLASGPQPGTATSASFAFSASEPAVFECRLDGVPFALCASLKSYDGLGVGDHRFEVRAIDSAGNVDATPVVHAWRISAVTPSVPAVKTTSALKAPKAGAVVKSPPLLVWQAVQGASYYNVQVYRGRKKVLSAWPTRPRLKLQARWKYLGRKQRLLPGVYRWYVWPGRGPASSRRYGRLLGQSTFTVRR